MSKRTTKGGRNGRNEPARVDTTLSAKLDVLDQLEMRFGRDFSEATSMLKEFRKELLDEAAKAVVKGTSDVVGSDEWFIARAKMEYESEGTVEIDDNAVVSRGSDPGAYVQMWGWVHNDESKDDDE